MLVLLWFISTPMSITVDDLPWHMDATESRATIAQRFVDVLRKHHVGEAYGFINAGHGFPEVLDIWKRGGFPLGNHTFRHLSLTYATTDEYFAQIHANEPFITGKFFRYPYLHEGRVPNKRRYVRERLAAEGYAIAHVTIDFEDYAWNNPHARCERAGNADAIRWLEDRYLHHARDSLENAMLLSERLFGRQVHHVLLLHIGQFDSLMLDRLLAYYESAGVTFVSLAESSRDPVYAIDPGIGLSGTLLERIQFERTGARPDTDDIPFDQLRQLCHTPQTCTNPSSCW